LPEFERKQFRELLLPAISTVSLMNVNLHSKNAEARVPEDAVRIKDDIQKDNGVFVHAQQIRISFSKILF
jgi:hypothetical protein